MTDTLRITGRVPEHCQMCGRREKRLAKRYNHYQRIYQWVCRDGCTPIRPETKRPPVRLGMTLKEMFEDAK